ncbi:MAG: DUF116 domain-containing protein [Candidatus Jordarchaeum sp.]|uniref:DUF116 domain-containing protein n=1 Tax=Candidatus Jordarchaeum sp. TaxID=2823881 RepID=UPI00404B6620
MPYRFNFDISEISEPLFNEIARFFEGDLHKRIGRKARYLVEKLKVHENTRLPITAAVKIVKDITDNHVENLSHRNEFLKTKNRALLLPHCSRKYMDNRCNAIFNTETTTYQCMHCSPDCKINQASTLGEKKGYTVYVLPGGSCIPKIMDSKKHDGVVGVACCEEIKLGRNYLKTIDIPAQGVPLVKNGCCETNFNLKTLESVLEKGI